MAVFTRFGLVLPLDYLLTGLTRMTGFPIFFPEHPWPRPLAQTWLARAGFYDFGSPSIATTALYSRQLAPGQANIPIMSEAN